MRTVALPVSAVGSRFAHGCALPPPDADQRAAWHRGRRRYAVWLIEADTPAVRALCARVRERLAPWLGPAPARQPHITLAACGFPVRVATDTDEYDIRQRCAQRDALNAALPPAFTVLVGGIGSFNGCAYLRVRDEGGVLERLQQTLCAPVPAARGQRYVPHVTVGTYRAPVPMRSVARAAATASSSAVRVTAKRLTLATFDPGVDDGALRPVVRVRLRTCAGDQAPVRGRNTGRPSTVPAASGCR